MKRDYKLYLSDIKECINKIDKLVPPITKFIIAGASEASAVLDFARSLSRRVERTIVAYSKKKKLNPELMRYSNRISSLIFALARSVNFRLKKKEVNPHYR